MPHFPLWLHLLSIVSIGLGVISALIIVVDETRQPQSMRIMNAVWPLTARRALTQIRTEGGDVNSGDDWRRAPPI